MPKHPSPRAPDHRHDGGAGPHVARHAAPGAPAPLLDPRVLQEMELDFDDTGVVARFARDFSATLGEKIDRLDERLRMGDELGAEQAVLSLITSASMVGADCLGAAARAARESLPADDGDSTRLVAELHACAAETLRELELIYPRSA